MLTANISKAKNELSRYLDAVRAGETVLILDRNRPIAQIRPLSSLDEGGGEARLTELEARGLIRRPEGSSASWVSELADMTACGAQPTGSVEALIAERESGR